ncbi:DUF1292 domain-containing protein [Lachnospiraceae bacterium HCP1S3_C3]|mgnify:CR=1 FL=1|nr:DUF1292 domain-containing protein [Lachnospiraceae bacterium]
MYGKLSFVDEAGEETEVYVIEETKINNMNYLLVTESDETDEDEELEAYIFKDVSDAEDEEAVYQMVDDDAELAYVSKIFDELLEDIDVK